MPIHRSVEIAWLSFVIFWFVAGLFASRAVKRQSRQARVLTIIVGAVPFCLLFTDFLRVGPLAWRFVPSTPFVLATGITLTYAGIALAIWARLLLGRNWSGTITI